MKLSEYFDDREGHGVIATADSTGNLTAAVYATPHFIDEETVAFIMADRLTHKNIESNPRAVYLFVESGENYDGKRLYLTKTREETDRQCIEDSRRKDVCPVEDGYKDGTRFLVYFHVDKVLPLVGDNEEAVDFGKSKARAEAEA